MEKESIFKSKIAVALDGSVLAETALPFAIKLAKLGEARLLLLRLTVLPAEVEIAYARENPHQVRPLDYLEKVRTSIITSSDENLRLEPDRVEVKVGRGKFAYEIPEEAEEAGAELIIITTHGLGGFTRLLLGSITQQTLRNSRLPVIVLRPGHLKPKERETTLSNPLLETVPNRSEPNGPALLTVAALLDGEPTAEAVLVPVCRLAEKIGAGVKLLQVVVNVPPLKLDEPLMEILYDPQEESSSLRVRQTEALAYLQQIKTKLEADWKNISFETEVLTGRPADELVNWAHKTSPFLMAMAMHARGEVGRFILGSVADEIMREGACPLLMVRIPKDYRGYAGEPLQAHAPVK